MCSPVKITVSCLHPNRAKWEQEKHLWSLVQAHLGSCLCLSFGASCLSLAWNTRCWFSLLKLPCALMRYWFFPPRWWNSAPEFGMLQVSTSPLIFLLDYFICRNVLNFPRSLFFGGVSGNITADCHASVFVFPDCVSWNFPSNLCSTPSAFSLLF